MLFEDHVRIDAAEAERIDAGAARMALAMNPRPRFGVQIERRGFQLQRRIRLVAQHRRQHLVMQGQRRLDQRRSEEHTSELQSLMRISYAVFCLKKKKKKQQKQE